MRTGSRSGAIRSRPRILTTLHSIKVKCSKRVRFLSTRRNRWDHCSFCWPGLYEDSVTAIAARGGLASFLSILEDRFCHIPEDVVVPGILEVADVSDIIAAQAPRPVLLEKCVDGRNRVDHHPDLHSSPGLIVRDAPARPGPRQPGSRRECSRKNGRGL